MEHTKSALAEFNPGSSILGFCSSHRDILYVRNQDVLVRNDTSFLRHPNRVMVISGGGAGREPGQQGFVGRGMLSAAVSGNIFTSPSVTSCLVAILLARDANRPILLVINNNTGDRLNFVLAVDMARSFYNYRNVKLLIIDDNCSIDDPRQSTDRRGLTGIHLINKIAGAMSESGACLEDIYNYCQAILTERWIRNIGFTFHRNVFNELNDIEIGYGNNGESESIKIEKEKSFAPVIHIIAERLKLNEVKSDVVLLFNNLSTFEFTFYNFIREFLEVMQGFEGLRIVKMYAGTFLTSLSREALSVTVLEVRDEKVLKLLEYPVIAASGHLFNSPLNVEFINVEIFQFPEPAKRLTSLENEAANFMASKVIRRVCTEIINCKYQLNEVGGEFGDGNIGSILSNGAESLISALDNDTLALNDPFEMLQQMSKTLRHALEGTKWMNFSVFFQCASKVFSVENAHSVGNWIKALTLGIEGVMEFSKFNVGDRTLIDALHAGQQSISEKLNSNGKVGLTTLLKVFAEACHEGSESTKFMSSSNHKSAQTLNDSNCSFVFKSIYPDAGAYAIDIISSEVLKAFTELLN